MTSKREGGLLEEALTHSVIGAFYDVHRGLGFGFREYLYALALERDLVARVIGSIVRSESWSIIEESHLLGGAPASFRS
jgi:PD-(D/E)XK nuclease superfamily